jgi:hypothetical protein
MQPARVQSRDMEKLRRREERDARHTWSRVVDYCAANQVSALLPTGRLFGRVSQKGPKKKWSGRTILRPNFGRF